MNIIFIRKNILVIACAILTTTTLLGMKHNLNTDYKDYKYKIVIGPIDEIDVFCIFTQTINGKCAEKISGQTYAHQESVEILLASQQNDVSVWDLRTREKIYTTPIPKEDVDEEQNVPLAYKIIFAEGKPKLLFAIRTNLNNARKIIYDMIDHTYVIKNFEINESPFIMKNFTVFLDPMEINLDPMKIHHINHVDYNLEIIKLKNITITHKAPKKIISILSKEIPTIISVDSKNGRSLLALDIREQTLELGKCKIDLYNTHTGTLLKKLSNQALPCTSSFKSPFGTKYNSLITVNYKNYFIHDLTNNVVVFNKIFPARLSEKLITTSQDESLILINHENHIYIYDNPMAKETKCRLQFFTNKKFPDVKVYCKSY